MVADGFATRRAPRIFTLALPSQTHTGPSDAPTPHQTNPFRDSHKSNLTLPAYFRDNHKKDFGVHMKDPFDLTTLDLLEVKPAKRRGRPSKNGLPMSAKDRKREQRTRTLYRTLNDPATWTEQECIYVLTTWRKTTSLGSAALQRLAELLGHHLKN